MALVDVTNPDVDLHFAVINSDKLKSFIYDHVKSLTDGNKDTIFYVRNKTDVEEMLELAWVLPFNAKQWLFIIEFDKVRGHARKILEMCKSDGRSFKMLLYFTKYADYKKLLERVPKANGMYLNSLGFNDCKFLFSKFKLNKKLFEFIYYSYRSEVDKLLEIREYLSIGGVLVKQKDVTDLVGVSAGSVQHFVYQLTSKVPLTIKSLKMTCKKRNEVLLELSKVFNRRGLKTILTRTVKDFLDIKTLYLNAETYKSIYKVPSGYDEARLRPYSKIYSKIIEIPYERLLQLYLTLENSGHWNSDLDLINFIYGWYNLVYDWESEE